LERRKRNSSPIELHCNLCRADRRADFEEKTMRLAELALAAGFVAGKPGELGAM
jgi:hypothetical protein